MEIKAISAIADVVDSNGNLFTSKALKEAIKNFSKCPVGYEFNPNIPPIGEVKTVEIKDGKLYSTVEIKNGKPFNEKLAIVPSFSIKKMHTEGDVKVIDEAEIIEMSLTSQPADKDVDRINL